MTQITCYCDDSNDEFDRVVCDIDESSTISGGVDCSGSVCVGERDIFIFQKASGRMEEKITCLECQGASECSGFDNVCFFATFNAQDDVVSCFLFRPDAPDTDSICDDCDPCRSSGGA